MKEATRSCNLNFARKNYHPLGNSKVSWSSNYASLKQQPQLQPSKQPDCSSPTAFAGISSDLNLIWN
jgi:hypothetical protein